MVGEVNKLYCRFFPEATEAELREFGQAHCARTMLPSFRDCRWPLSKDERFLNLIHPNLVEYGRATKCALPSQNGYFNMILLARALTRSWWLAMTSVSGERRNFAPRRRPTKSAGFWRWHDTKKDGNRSLRRGRELRTGLLCGASAPGSAKTALASPSHNPRKCSSISSSVLPFVSGRNKATVSR
jgi:hypothetical protein